MRNTRILLALGCVALFASCGLFLESETSVSGSVTLGQAIEGDPFYDPIIEQALIDARQLSSLPLAAFELPSNRADLVEGSVEPIGQLRELRVGRWSVVDDGTLLDCVGFAVGDADAGSECAPLDLARPNPEVTYQVACRSGRLPRWLAFTVDERVDALRVDVEDDISVVGDDPEDTGLIAVEGVGNVTTATAQTTTGQVWSLDFDVTCPAD